MRKFHETAPCPLCGEAARVIAMDSHQGSTRCQLGRVRNTMRERDWSVIDQDIGSTWVKAVFDPLGIPWEHAIWYVDRAGAPEYGTWAPTWACVLTSVMQDMDAFRTRDRFARVSTNRELQCAITSAHMLAVESEADPKMAVIVVLAADSPDLYKRNRR